MTKWKIAEIFLQSKKGHDDGGEDGYIVTDHFAAVVDGATSKVPQTYKRKTTGQHARDICLEVIRNLPSEVTLEAACEALTTSIFEAYAEVDPSLPQLVKESPLHRFTTSVTLFSFYRNVIWFIGDGGAIIGEKAIDNSKRLDEICAAERSAVLKKAVVSGEIQESDIANNDIGRAAVLKQIEDTYNYQNDANRDLGFAVINGFPVALNKVRSEAVSKDVDTIILASDGYPVLKSTLAASEAELARIIEEDPYCYKEYKSTKGLKVGNVSFDDRTYLKLTKN